jgi:hypothetical protein
LLQVSPEPQVPSPQYPHELLHFPSSQQVRPEQQPFEEQLQEEPLPQQLLPVPPQLDLHVPLQHFKPGQQPPPPEQLHELPELQQEVLFCVPNPVMLFDPTKFSKEIVIITIDKTRSETTSIWERVFSFMASLILNRFLYFTQAVFFFRL